MTVKELHLRMGSMDMSKSVHTRKGFVAVALVSCEKAFRQIKCQDKFKIHIKDKKTLGVVNTELSSDCR